MHYRAVMHVFEADERDSAWEIDTPRFRIYVFEGPQNAVTVSDVVDANVEQALEAGRALSGKDSRLWSLALVQDDERRGRGLIWLSGNDYNDSSPPDVDAAAHWSARGAMQNRYLMARAHAAEPVVLPTGERVVRFFPEYGVDLPLWESFTENYPVERGVLFLPTELEDALVAWNERWSSLVGLDGSTAAARDQWTAWRHDGLAFAGSPQVGPQRPGGGAARVSHGLLNVDRSRSARASNCASVVADRPPPHSHPIRRPTSVSSQGLCATRNEATGLAQLALSGQPE